MKLDYGTQLSPLPISLRAGDSYILVKKPKMMDIADITFQVFSVFEAYLKMTPESYYIDILNRKEDWESIPEEDRSNISMIDICDIDADVATVYEHLLEFFLSHKVIYHDGLFLVLSDEMIEDDDKLDNIIFAINKNLFDQLLIIIQQICGMDYEEQEDIESLKFKNSKARELYERMQAAKKRKKEAKKADVNLTLPNIVSVVSNNHPSINPITVWDLTVFQLLDAFNRLQLDRIYDIDKTRVSVWGDEKNKFDSSMWYKNEYDKK